MQIYVVLLIEEMKVVANLVLVKVRGKLNGLTDLGYTHSNFVVLQKADNKATYALVFVVRGMWTEFTFCYNTSYC